MTDPIEAWGNVMVQAAQTVEYAPLERSGGRPIDYVGVGLIAGWTLASMLAATDPALLTRLYRMILEDTPMPDQQAKWREEWLAPLIDALRDG